MLDPPSCSGSQRVPAMAAVDSAHEQTKEENHEEDHHDEQQVSDLTYFPSYQGK